MFELLTTDAFATWFSTLAPEPTEDVAATLEVIVQLGTTLEAPGSSDLLLWYEHPSLAQRPLPDFSALFVPEFLKFSQDWGHFMSYFKRVIKHLESAPFVARLGRLSGANAAAVSRAVAQIRQIGKSRPLALAAFQIKNQRTFLRASRVSPDIAGLVRFADVAEVRAAYFTALSAAGFEVADLPARSDALREITLRSTAPGLRLLYGLDPARSRGLVVLGEWLDRSFYGDAVRRAEAQWGEFMEGRPVSVQPAVGR